MTNKRNERERGGLARARADAGPPGESPAMREWAETLVNRARDEGVSLTGEDGLLTAMVRQVLQTGLEVEMADRHELLCHLCTLAEATTGLGVVRAHLDSPSMKQTRDG